MDNIGEVKYKLYDAQKCEIREETEKSINSLFEKGIINGEQKQKLLSLYLSGEVSFGDDGLTEEEAKNFSSDTFKKIENALHEFTDKFRTKTMYVIQPGDTPKIIAEKMGLTGEDAEKFANEVKDTAERQGLWYKYGFRVGDLIQLNGDFQEKIDELKQNGEYYETTEEINNNYNEVVRQRRGVHRRGGSGEGKPSEPGTKTEPDEPGTPEVPDKPGKPAKPSQPTRPSRPTPTRKPPLEVHDTPESPRRKTGPTEAQKAAAENIYNEAINLLKDQDNTKDLINEHLVADIDYEKYYLVNKNWYNKLIKIFEDEEIYSDNSFINTEENIRNALKMKNIDLTTKYKLYSKRKKKLEDLKKVVNEEIFGLIVPKGFMLIKENVLNNCFKLIDYSEFYKKYLYEVKFGENYIFIKDKTKSNNKNSETILTVRRTAGLVFQNPEDQIVSTVVEEDVAFGPENLAVPTDEIRKRVDDSLTLVEMRKFAKRSPLNLSGGQKQRVAIAGILAMQPKCLVLDEPTSMLDPVGREEVINTLKSLNKEGITIILITHNMEEIVDVDKVFVMNKGELEMQGTPREIFKEVDKLKSFGLEVPQVTELAYELRKNGVQISDSILTAKDLVSELETLKG